VYIASHSASTMGTVKEVLSSAMSLLPNKKILLKDVNEIITCRLCEGYFIDATTITECLHTFCKSCIVTHLEDETSCPTCETQIHQSYPLNYIAHDRTMQDIVYKLVPHLLEDETERERLFYEERGLPNPKDEKAEEDDDEEEDGEEDNEEGDEENPEKKKKKEDSNEAEKEGEEEDPKTTFRYHREDEQVNICLEPYVDSDMTDLKKKFIRCSSQATITHVKKYVALKLWNDATKFKELDILCNDNCCGKDHTLKFVVISNWKCQQYPMELKYRPKCEFF